MCFYSGDADYPEFYNSSFHKAQKKYKCDDCFGLIWPGERYERVAGKWDGKICQFRICGRCNSLREKIVAVEISRGCSWQESHPLLGALMSQLDDTYSSERDEDETSAEFIERQYRYLQEIGELHAEY